MKRGLAIIFFLSLIGIVSASSGTYIGDFYVDLEITISILLFLSFFWFTNFIFRKSAFNEVSKVIISLCFSLGMLWGVLKLELTISISDFLTNLGLSDIILSAAPWIIIGFLILGWIKFGFGSTLFFVGIGFFIFGWIGHLLDIVYRWQFLMIVGGIIGFIGFLIMKKKLGKVLKGVGKGAWKAAKWTGKQAVGAVGTGLDAQIEKNRTRQDKRNQIIAKMTKHCNFIKELVNKKKYRKAQKAINILKKILKRNKRTLGKNNYEYFMRWVQEMELTIQELTRKPRVTTSNIYDLINNRQKKSNTTNQLALPLAQQPLASPPAQQPLALESKDMRRQREMKEFEKDFKEFTSINLDSKIPIVLIRQIRKKRYKAHRLIKKYKGSDIPYIKERIPTIKEYYQILKNAERDTLNKL